MLISWCTFLQNIPIGSESQLEMVWDLSADQWLCYGPWPPNWSLGKAEVSNGVVTRVFIGHSPLLLADRLQQQANGKVDITHPNKPPA